MSGQRAAGRAAALWPYQRVTSEQCETLHLAAVSILEPALYNVNIIVHPVGALLNMGRIESRPSKRELGEYIFFVDLERGEQGEDLPLALAQLEPLCEHLMLFGAYPLTNLAAEEAQP